MRKAGTGGSPASATRLALNRPLASNGASQRRASRTNLDPLLGQTIAGDFQIVRPLGAGSHADVFVAEQVSVGHRLVALKILSRLHLNLREADFRRAAMALLREGELLGGLHSACFVDVYSTGMLADERPFMAMEFIEGRTLADILNTEGPLPADVVVDIALGMSTGLAELHDQGLVHRDVTPANLIVSRNPAGALEVKTFDFGTVTRISGRADRHRVGYDPDHPLGTPSYMSPEQAAAGVVDGRSDQFALASIMHEMLTGRRTFVVDGPGARPLLAYLRGDQPIPARSLAGDRAVPSGLAKAVERALRRDPAERFATMVDFISALSTVRSRARARTGRSGRSLIGRLLGSSR